MSVFTYIHALWIETVKRKFTNCKIVTWNILEIGSLLIYKVKLQSHSSTFFFFRSYINRCKKPCKLYRTRVILLKCIPYARQSKLWLLWKIHFLDLWVRLITKSRYPKKCCLLLNSKEIFLYIGCVLMFFLCQFYFDISSFSKILKLFPWDMILYNW